MNTKQKVRDAVERRQARFGPGLFTLTSPKGTVLTLSVEPTPAREGGMAFFVRRMEASGNQFLGLAVEGKLIPSKKPGSATELDPAFRVALAWLQGGLQAAWRVEEVPLDF